MRLLAIVFLITSLSTSACICPELSAITKQKCGSYEWIAYGKVGSVKGCPEGSFEFHPLNIFKGAYADVVPVALDCEYECVPDIVEGDTWILYGKLNNAQEVYLNFCGHSHKRLPDSVQDYHAELAGMSFKAELAFLQDNFNTVEETNRKEIGELKYEKVDPALVPWLLGGGLVFMVVGYFVFNAVMKRKGD